MKNIILVAVVTASVLLFGGPVHGQSDPACPASMADLMSAKEFEAAGLETLTPAQLGALSRWADAYRRQVTAADAEGGRPNGTVAEGAPIHSRIDGVFDGLEGKTIFKLANGQVWQQERPRRAVLLRERPERRHLHVVQDEVDGLAGEVAVRRLQ